MRKLLYFASNACPPCVRIWRCVVETEILPYVEKEQVEYIVADENRTLAKSYGIQYTPTIILVEDDKEYGRRVGDPRPRLHDIMMWLTEGKYDKDTSFPEPTEREGTLSGSEDSAQ